MEKIIKVSCEMIIEDEGRLLMGRRGNVFGKGSWAFPGGHLEYNERTEDCVRRELEEELGITPDGIELLGVINDIRKAEQEEDAGHYIRFVYLIKKFSGEITNKEPERCKGWEWKEKDHLPNPIFVGHQKPLELYLTHNKKFFLE